MRLFLLEPVAPFLQCRQHGCKCFAVVGQAVFHSWRDFGIHSTQNDAVGLQCAQLRGQRALRHIGQDAADLVEAQRTVRVQAVEYRSFPFAADDGKRGFHRTAFGAVVAWVRCAGHDGILLNCVISFFYFLYTVGIYFQTIWFRKYR